MAAGAFFCSCPKEKLTAPNPDFEYFVVRNTDTIFSPESVEVGEIVNFRNTGSGDYFSIFPGEASNSYSSQTDSSATGVDVNRVGRKGAGVALRRSGLYYSAEYIYRNQGSYEIVYVATSTANYASETSKEIRKGMFIKVTDGRTKMSEIKSQDSNRDEVKTKVSTNEDTVFLLVDYGWSLNVVDIKFQIGNATAVRDGKPVAKEGIGYRDRKVDVSKPIVYSITAPDGITKRDVVFLVKPYDRYVSDDRSIKSISISGVPFVAKTDGKYELFYPNGKTSEAVTFACNEYATIVIGDKSFKSTDAITIADLKNGSGSVQVLSESKVSATYNFTLTEEVLKPTPLSFSNATGFPVVKGVGDTLNVYLSSSLDFKKLIPVYPASNFTVIQYGNDQTVLKNGVDMVDYSLPVTFTLTNGLMSIKQVIVLKAL